MLIFPPGTKKNTWDDVQSLTPEEVNALQEQLAQPNMNLGGMSGLDVALSEHAGAPVTLPTAILVRLVRTAALAVLPVEGPPPPSRIDFTRFTGETYLEETPTMASIREFVSQGTKPEDT